MTVTNSGAIHTYGGYSGSTSTSSVKLGGGIAILAQSIGGGGGVNTGQGAYGGIGGAYLKGAPSDEGSDGGTVTLTNKADGKLTTAGAEAHGILAQSIGGGGGTGRNASGLFKAVGGAGGAGGAGGSVTVENYAAITVGGGYAGGIVARRRGLAHRAHGLVQILEREPAVGREAVAHLRRAGLRGGEPVELVDGDIAFTPDQI